MGVLPRVGSGFRRGLWAAVMVLTAGFVFASSASAASGDCDATVGDVVALNAAITCYNAETVAGAHTITLGSDILATGPSLDIAGPAGATLLIDGDSHTYDANSLARGFTVLNSGDVTFTNITITGGDSTLILKGGGGILNLGRTRVQNSTIVGNEGTFGGGILNEFGVGALPVLNVFNSTITDNTASGASGFGAGIYNNFNEVTIVFSTITDNTGSSAVASWSDSDTSTAIAASIIADNNVSSSDLALTGSFDSFSSGGDNVIGSVGASILAFPQPGDLINQSGVVGTLFDNGGPTDTHLPIGVPIDKVFAMPNLFGETPPAADQRGVARPSGRARDAGAVEVEHLLTVLPSPCAVLDTTGPLGGGQLSATPRNVSVTGVLPTDQGVSSGTCVPASAQATSVVVTVSALDPTGPGNLRLSEAGVAAQGGVVNYHSNGLNNANTVTVPLSTAGELDMSANNFASDARLAVVGYYHPAGTQRFNSVTPCAAADSRSGENPSGAFAGPFAGGASYPDIDVVGDFNLVGDDQGGNNTNCEVPDGADSVVINLVAIRPATVTGFGGQGYLSTGPGGSNPFEPVTPFADLTLNNAASIIVPVDVSGKIAIDIDQLGATPVSSEVRVVVLGYLETTAGSSYSPVNPCNAFDTRTLGSDPDNPPVGLFAGKRSHATPTTYNVTGLIPTDQGGQSDCGVPEGASAVLINLVAIQPDNAGNFRAYAFGTSPTGGVVNFAPLTPAMNNSNTIVVPVDSNGNLVLDVNSPLAVGPIVDVRGVILGYYG